MGRKSRLENACSVSSSTLEAKLPEGWEIVKYREGSEYAIVKIRVDDIERIRLLKLPEQVREYLRHKQRKYREKLKKEGKSIS
ncbi:MAG: hypothetical protein QW270_06400 [Candidatus Bathyarchaeia archaeon]